MFHKVKHPYQEDDEEITHYAQTLTKWTTENFSPGYYELRKQLPNDVTTLPQLLVQKDDIMKALLDHMKSCDIESLQPTLEYVCISLVNIILVAYLRILFIQVGRCDGERSKERVLPVF